MPLHLFDHHNTTELRDEFDVDGEFNHSFGVSPNHQVNQQSSDH